jgi:hypothetical protein
VASCSLTAELLEEKHELLQSVVSRLNCDFCRARQLDFDVLKPVLQKLFFVFRLFPPRPVVPY